MRKAFTIVEILVVVTIIGLLVGLLVPAVIAARESARRAACQNNLHQLSVAVELFQTGHKRYPPGSFTTKPQVGAGTTSWSWLARILPDVDRADLFQMGRTSRETLQQSGVAAQYVQVFLCPSGIAPGGAPRLDAGDLAGFAAGQTNYKGVSGANWGSDSSQNMNDINTLWPNPGTNGSADGLDNGDGILWRNDISFNINQDSVKDGLSNTFLIGEDVPQQNRWCSWPYANNAYGTCAIPPNFTWADTNWWPNTWSFRSNHPAGLQFAFADGSVHFIRADIELAVYRGLATRYGKEAVGGF